VAFIVVALVALAIVAWNGRDRTSALGDVRISHAKNMETADRITWAVEPLSS